MDRLVKPAALALTIAGLPLAADARTDRPDLFVDV